MYSSTFQLILSHGGARRGTPTVAVRLGTHLVRILVGNTDVRDIEARPTRAVRARPADRNTNSVDFAPMVRGTH